MLFILCIRYPPPIARGFSGACPAAVSIRSCGLLDLNGKLKLDSNGVVGVVLCDLAVGKGGKAQSWGTGSTGDVGRLGNGDVELRTKGILKGYLEPLPWIAGEALRGVLAAMGSGKCLSVWRIESTLHDIISLGTLCVQVSGSGHIQVEAALSRGGIGF